MSSRAQPGLFVTLETVRNRTLHASQRNAEPAALDPSYSCPTSESVAELGIRSG